MHIRPWPTPTVTAVELVRIGSNNIVDAAYSVDKLGMRVGVNGDRVAPMESHDNLGEVGLNSIDWAAPTMMMKSAKRSEDDVLLR